MRFATSMLVGAIGAAVRLEVAAEVAGFKMHAVGVTLIVIGIVGIGASVKSWSAGPLRRVFEFKVAR